jgi:selenide, water dikinase
VCFPPDGDLDVLEQIMLGGMAKMKEASCVVVGGHSVRDNEIKFGYAVTGLIDPDRVLTNAAALEGDVLILTKPIGTGVITTALKQGKAQPEWIANAVESMTTLNRTASQLVAAATGVHAMTDVTGFGLMGHGRELALGSGMTIEIVVDQVPRIDGAVSAIHLGAIPAGLLANREFAECLSADVEGSQIPDELRTLLYDPQTAGGLLIAVAADSADSLLSSLRGAGLNAARIGSVLGPYISGKGTPAIQLR